MNIRHILQTAQTVAHTLTQYPAQIRTATSLVVRIGVRAREGQL